VEFVRLYLAGRGAELAVDPACTTPALLLALVDGDIAHRGLGLMRDPGLGEAVAAAARNGRLQWASDWWVAPLPDKPGPIGQPSLIVSLPPAGMPVTKGRYPRPDGGVVTVGDHAGLHALTAARELAEGGEALFIVPNEFAVKRGASKLGTALEALGLHVHACVELVSPFRDTGLAFSLLSIRKVPAESTWIGRLSPHVDLQQFARALRERTVGRTPELGRLVEWKNFYGFEKVVAGERLERLEQKAGFARVALHDVLRSEPLRPQTKPDRSDADIIEPTRNTVYLPTFLSATVWSDADADGLKASGYITLALDPEQALSEYVALVLNSELGRALRATLSGGATMPSIRLAALPSAALPLPPLEIQQQVIATRQTVRDMRLALDDIERDLIARPRDTKRLRRQLREVGQADPVKAWMETLPFPLASVAWRYRADADAKDKVDHLLRLFEASAMFFTTLLLSAFDGDEDLLGQERPKWGDEQGDLRLTRASFGTWTKLGAAMAAGTRRLLSSSENDGALKEQMASALTVRSPAFVDMLTGRELWKTLDALTGERNEDAHGGIQGAAEREHKLARLEVDLAKLRALTWEPMQEVRLVRPGDGSFRKGVNQYRKALDLSGFVDAFPATLLESTQQMEADELYLVDVSDEPVKGGLKLAPLVRLRPSPSTQENACYFYSRLDGEQAEYVSHHFDRESRITGADADLMAFFGRLASAEASPSRSA
jgi:hypothetical protein